MDARGQTLKNQAENSLGKGEIWRARQGSNLRPSASKADEADPRNTLRSRLLPLKWPRRATAWCHADASDAAFRQLARRLGNPVGGRVPQVSGGVVALGFALLWLLTAAGVAWLGLPADVVAPSGTTYLDVIV